MAWRNWSVVAILILANWVVFSALANFVFPPAPLTPPVHAVKATFTPGILDLQNVGSLPYTFLTPTVTATATFTPTQTLTGTLTVTGTRTVTTTQTVTATRSIAGTSAVTGTLPFTGTQTVTATSPARTPASTIPATRAP